VSTNGQAAGRKREKKEGQIEIVVSSCGLKRKEYLSWCRFSELSHSGAKAPVQTLQKDVAAAW
jgi:hypothetical protein